MHCDGSEPDDLLLELSHALHKALLFVWQKRGALRQSERTGMGHRCPIETNPRGGV
jgi:hypothetical protein